MKQTTLICIIIGILLLIFLLSRSSTERYGTVLGAAGNYGQGLVNCLNDCEREDPDKRLQGQSNFNCSIYCDYVISDMAQKGIPPEEFPVHNNLKKCEIQCSAPNATETEFRKCVSVCYGQREALQYCKELQCPYSLDDENTCLKQCASTQGINSNQVSWNWLRG